MRKSWREAISSWYCTTGGQVWVVEKNRNKAKSPEVKESYCGWKWTFDFMISQHCMQQWEGQRNLAVGCHFVSSIPLMRMVMSLTKVGFSALRFGAWRLNICGPLSLVPYIIGCCHHVESLLRHPGLQWLQALAKKAQQHFCIIQSITLICEATISHASAQAYSCPIWLTRWCRLGSCYGTAFKWTCSFRGAQRLHWDIILLIVPACCPRISAPANDSWDNSTICTHLCTHLWCIRTNSPYLNQKRCDNALEIMARMNIQGAQQKTAIHASLRTSGSSMQNFEHCTQRTTSLFLPSPDWIFAFANLNGGCRNILEAWCCFPCMANGSFEVIRQGSARQVRSWSCNYLQARPLPKGTKGDCRSTEYWCPLLQQKVIISRNVSQAWSWIASEGRRQDCRRPMVQLCEYRAVEMWNKFSPVHSLLYWSHRMCSRWKLTLGQFWLVLAQLDWQVVWFTCL